MEPELDATELLHLAIYATNHGTPESAIDHLKKLLKKEPNNGKALYLLGALHAEIGMHEQAVEEMTQALNVASDLPDTAVFQLGLLHITAGRIEEAASVWQPLDALDHKHPLYLFKQGMLHLVKDEFAQCIDCLSEGIQLNKLYDDLNSDMQRVLADAEQAALKQHGARTDTAPPATDPGQPEIPRSRLSIYERDNHDA